MHAHDQTLHRERPRFERGFHSVGEQTWAWLQPNGGLGESNAGLVASGDHVLVVDSLWDLKLTRAMLNAARELVDAPVEILVNTHSDGDHCWGNQLFSNARIISGATAKRLMTLDTPKQLRAMQRSGRALGKIGRLPLPLIGTRDYGRLPRLPLRDLGNEFAPFDWSEVELTLPTETFEGQLDLMLGERAVSLIEVGPAHTGGDTVVWLPDARVCFAADILFIGGTPVMWAGPISSWVAAIDTISALGAERYVPGHGPICGQAEVDSLREYFQWVGSEGGALLDRGVSPAKAARKLLLSGEFADLPWAKWSDPERLVVTLSAEQHVRDGGSDHIVGAARSRVVAQMQLAKTALARART